MVTDKRVTCEEATEWLSSIETDSADCVIADPPYNVSGDKLSAPDENFETMDEEWDEFTVDEYQQFTHKWLSEAVRVCKPSGSIVVFGSYHNIGHVNVELQHNDVELLNEIVWFKNNAMPNLRCNRFTASHETALWGTPQQDGEAGEYTFNYEQTKQWPFDTDTHTSSGKQTRSVWEIPTNKSTLGRNCDHPNQKPLRLLIPLLSATTNECDIVIDPFVGSGATLVAAKLLGCDYYGCDMNDKYVDMARQLLKSADETPSAVVEQVGDLERLL